MEQNYVTLCIENFRPQNLQSYDVESLNWVCLPIAEPTRTPVCQHQCEQPHWNTRAEN